MLIRSAEGRRPISASVHSRIAQGIDQGDQNSVTVTHSKRHSPLPRVITLTKRHSPLPRDIHPYKETVTPTKRHSALQRERFSGLLRLQSQATFRRAVAPPLPLRGYIQNIDRLKVYDIIQNIVRVRVYDIRVLN
jgi:hypothetical protein